MITQTSELRLQVGGAVSPYTGIYIFRPSDEELPRLLERGEYANVFCSRQTGKTSLLKRTKTRLFEKGYATAEVEVAGYLGSPDDADTWYQGLLEEIADQLRLDVDFRAWWESCRAITPNQRLIRFFRDEVAAKTSAPAIIFLDEIDSTIALPYTDDFFVAIRAMYNDRASERLFERITFCLAGVATPNELIKNRRTTPYNIGRTIELPDFDPERDDLRPLFSAVADDPIKGEAIVRAVLRWTGGHPYLTMRLCDQFVAQGRTSPDEVDDVVNKAFVSIHQLHADVHFQQAVRFLDERVEDKLTTIALYRLILSDQQVRDQSTPAHIALRLAGIVKRDWHGYLIVRNPIYARIFSDKWAAAKAVSADSIKELLHDEKYRRVHEVIGGGIERILAEHLASNPRDLIKVAETIAKQRLQELELLKLADSIEDPVIKKAMIEKLTGKPSDLLSSVSPVAPSDPQVAAGSDADEDEDVPPDFR